MKLNPACFPSEPILDKILKFGMQQVKLSRDKKKTEGLIRVSRYIVGSVVLFSFLMKRPIMHIL